MFLNFVLKVLYPIVNAVVAWSDKQQQIYNEYQSPMAKSKRRFLLDVKQANEELAENARFIKWREKHPDLSRI